MKSSPWEHQLAANMIRQAYSDLLSTAQTTEARHARDSALRWLHSEDYLAWCRILHINAHQVRNEILKQSKAA